MNYLGAEVNSSYSDEKIGCNFMNYLGVEVHPSYSDEKNSSFIDSNQFKF